jgi:hypothetical protein
VSRALLIHTARNWIPTDGRVGEIDVTHASFVPSAASGRIEGGASRFPDPLEFDVIISDFANLIGNGTFDLAVYQGAEAARAPLKGMAGIREAEARARDCRNDLTLAVESGCIGVFIVGAEPLNPFSTFNLPRTLRWGSQNEFAGAATCIWQEDLSDELKALRMEFRDDWRWERIIEATGWRPPMPQGPLGNSLPQFQLPMPPAAQVLCINKLGHTVGALQPMGRGEQFLLPNVPDPKRRSQLVRYLLEEFLPSRHPKLRAWISTAWPRAVVAEGQAFAAEAQRVRVALDSRRAALQDLQTRVLPYRDLLTLKGEDLKQLVAKVFREVFGLSVRDLDAEPGRKRFDLLVSDGSTDFAVDVSGMRTGSLKTKDLNDLEKQIRDFPSQRRLSPVLVVNAGCSFPPSDAKRRIDPAQAADALGRGISVLSTMTLFDLVGDVLSNGKVPECLTQLLKKPGLVSD